MYRVLIADYKAYETSAEIPFLFKKAGCIVDVYCAKNSWLLKNRYWDTWHPADTHDPATYAKELAACVQDTSYDWVVLTDDHAIRVMNDLIDDDALAKKILPVSKLEHRSMLGSKAALSILCEKHGLLTPPFAIYNSEIDVKASAAHISFPLMVKVDRSGGGRGVFFCAGMAELTNTLRSLPEENKKDLVFQKYVSGDNIAVEALYRQGTLLAYARSKVMRMVGGEFSVSSVRQYSADYCIEGDLRHIGGALGIDGFCSFTFMQDAHTGVRYMIEADLRPHAWFSLARFGGVDFSSAIKGYLSNTDVLVRQTASLDATPIEIRHFSRDINWSIDHKNILNIIQWCCNSEGRWRYIPWYDKCMFFAVLTQLARTHLYHIVFLRPYFRACSIFIKKIGTSV